MNRVSRMSGLAAAAAMIAACATPGKLTPKEPLQAKLSGYPLLQVQVVDDKGVNPQFASAFEQTLTRTLREGNVFQKTVKIEKSPEAQGLVLKLDLTKYKKGNKILRYMNLFGDTEVAFAGELTDASNNRVLSQFQLQGSSMRESRAHIGVGSLNFDTGVIQSFDDLDQRAIKAATYEMVDYLRTHM